MGISHSKTETCEPLRLCKERKHYMKQAVDSRYDLAAAHIVYVQSLRNIGITIGKFAETEIGCNYAVNYMISGGGVNAGTVNMNSSKISNTNQVYVEDAESPQPPLPRFSWDYFDPTDGSFRLMSRDRRKHDPNAHCDDDHLSDSESHGSGSVLENDKTEPDACSDSKDNCLTVDETDDPLEFIPYGGKDFASGIKEIEDCFIRASKSGDEISRMLEANKIQISYSEANGGSSGSSSSRLTCFGGNALVLHEPQQTTTKVITWKRSMSSSPSLLCLPGPPSTDDNENKFVQEFCMIAGSHSSSLDRLYAWERKLYDEVKASESIRKEYDKKCDELRRQSSKLKIDKTRAAAKHLHSRMKVALHTVDSISKRIEKLRDEELQPQLMELIQGLVRMWKSMLECHHAQYTTMTSANHSRTRTNHTETNNHMTMVELEHEVECLGSAFSDLVKSYTSYIESINNWIQNCITQPKERVKGRRAFSPRRAVAPPIFIMCRDWSGGFRTLPSEKVSDVIKELLCKIRRLSVEEEMKNKELSLNGNGNGEEKKITVWDLSMVDGSLTKVFDRLTNYCEESWKMYQDIKEKSETAGNLYSNYGRPPSRPSNV